VGKWARVVFWGRLPLFFATAPASVNDRSAEPRWTLPSLSSQPPKHKGDVPSGVDVSVPNCPAVVALPDSIQRWTCTALGIIFASNGTEITIILSDITHPSFSTSIQPSTRFSDAVERNVLVALWAGLSGTGSS